MDNKKQEGKFKYVEMLALLVVVLMSFAANLPEKIVGHAIDREVLLAALAATAVIALFRHLRFLLFVAVIAVTLGANMPGEIAALLGVNPVALVIALLLMVALSLLNYVLLLLPTGDKENKIDTLFSRKAVLGAIAENNLSRLIRLLEINVEINFDHDGKVPLLLAAEKGHTEIVEVLVHYGADLWVRDEKGKIPMEVALAHGFARVAEILHYAAEEKRATA